MSWLKTLRVMSTSSTTAFSKDGVVVRSTEPELSKVETGNKSFEIFGLV